MNSFAQVKKLKITRREFVKEVRGVEVAGAFIDSSKGENVVASCGPLCGACLMYPATQGKDKQIPKALQQQLAFAEYEMADGVSSVRRLPRQWAARRFLPDARHPRMRDEEIKGKTVRLDFRIRMRPHYQL